LYRLPSVNAERLHAVVNAIEDEMSAVKMVGLLQQLRDSLQQLGSEPGQPSHQQSASDARTQLNEVLSTAPSNEWAASDHEALEELGVDDLVGQPLLDQIEEILSRNDMTPSAAATELDPIVQRVEQLQSAVTNLRNGLSFFAIGAEELAPGEFEIGFVIPRRAVKEDVELLGKEFIKLQQILGPFMELADSREAVRVRSISSSSFAAFLDSAPAVALMVASTVERLIAAYKNVLDIRISRQKLKEAGASDKTLKAAAADAEAAMGKEIGKVVTEMMRQAKHVEPGRKHELKMALKVSLNLLANRIDRGYSIDVRVGELPAAPDEDDAEARPESKEDRQKREVVEQVRRKQESLRFTNPAGEPILSLPEPTGDVGSTTGPKGSGSGSRTSPRGRGRSGPSRSSK
jgi:flavin-binding protein dodecin